MNWLKKIGFLDFLIKTLGSDGIFSSGQEGHAFLIGISEVIAFWKPRFGMPEDYEANGNPLREYHYYMFGRFCGVLVWIGLIALIKVILI